MTELRDGKFSYDASGRLCFEIFEVEADQYVPLLREVVGEFELKGNGKEVHGLDEVFCDYFRGSQVVGIEWDNWSGFIVVAKNEDAESLVREIGRFLLA